VHAKSTTILNPKGQKGEGEGLPFFNESAQNVVVANMHAPMSFLKKKSSLNPCLVRGSFIKNSNPELRKKKSQNPSRP